METAAVHPGNPFTALINAYRRPVPSLILVSFSLCFDFSLEFSFFSVCMSAGTGLQAPCFLFIYLLILPCQYFQQLRSVWVLGF